MTKRKLQARAAIRQNFYLFVLRVLHELYPGELTSYNIGYLEALCRALQDVVDGRTRRLLGTVPPRHLKSTCGSVALPAFMLGHHPYWEILLLSYGDDLLGVHSEQFRQVIRSLWYQAAFPGVEIRKGQDRASEVVTTAGGRRKAVSIQGGITGRGADVVIMDDMMKADDIHSDTMRERAKQVYRGTIRSRQNDQTNVREIALQQRLGVDDFAGYLLDTGTFQHFNLPLVAEMDEEFPVYNGRTYRRREGDILNPDRMSPDAVEDLRRTMGEPVFQSQYQQNPSIVGDNSIRFEEIAKSEYPPDRSLCAPVIQSWDPAFTVNPTSDFSVCTTWGRYEARWHLLDVLRRRMDFVELQRRVVAMRSRWMADKVVVELDGSGRALVQQLRQEGNPWITGTKTGLKNKEQRLIDQAARLVSGDFVIPTRVSWFNELRREFMAFPNGNHDDQVDSISQFVAWISSGRGRSFLDTNPTTGRRRMAGRRSRRRN